MLTLEHKLQRKGKATSSDIHKIMGIQGLNKMGDTYALEKAIEIVFGIDQEDDFESYDMKIGSEREPLNFDIFKRKMELEFNKVEPAKFFELGLNTGSTPDGIVNGKDPLECKCQSSDHYFKLLRYGVDYIDPKWIFQMQHQMLVLGSDKAYFSPFTIFNSLPYQHDYIIPRDNKVTDLMIKRIDEWAKLRDQHVEILLTKKQAL